MQVRYYRDLHVWRRAMALRVESYTLARRMPRSETFGLASQLRRAAASVPANIAEGNGRLHRGDYVRHLSIARGSLREVETYLYAARELRYARDGELRRAFELCAEVGRMLVVLMRKLGEAGNGE